MAIVMSDQSQSRNWRRQRYEERAAQEARDAAEKRHKEKCLVLEALLQTYYAPRKPLKEGTYGGDMTKDPDDSDAVNSCELEHDFVLWMQTNRLTDHEEARRLHQVERALGALLEAHPYWYHVVSTHHRTGHSLSYLADLWRQGDHRVSGAYNSGLDHLIGQLNPAGVAELAELAELA